MIKTRPQNRRRTKNARPKNILEVRARTRTVRRKRRAIIFRVVSIMLLIAFVGIAGFYGIHKGVEKFFIGNPSYKMTDRDLRSGGAMHQDELAQLSGVSLGDNLFTLNIGEIERRIRKDPRVASVQIERHFPNKLSIVLTRRTPVAWIGVDEQQSDAEGDPGIFLLSDEGILMQRMPGYEFNSGNLPMIFVGSFLLENKTGDRLKDASVKASLNLLAAMNKDAEGLFRIRSIDIRKPLRLSVVTDNGIHVLFSPDQPEDQIHRFNHILHMCLDNGRRLKSVNLMVKRNTPLIFEDPPAPEVKSSKGSSSSSVKPHVSRSVSEKASSSQTRNVRRTKTSSR